MSPVEAVFAGARKNGLGTLLALVSQASRIFPHARKILRGREEGYFSALPSPQYFTHMRKNTAGLRDYVGACVSFPYNMGIRARLYIVRLHISNLP